VGVVLGLVPVFLQPHHRMCRTMQGRVLQKRQGTANIDWRRFRNPAEDPPCHRRLVVGVVLGLGLQLGQMWGLQLVADTCRK
jgi:hypothetical protein